jgi:uncharacterized protein (TIGR04255 family)
MDKKNLKNKPLVEAILEMSWKLQEKSPDIYVDPNYKILVGRLYDRLLKEYPFPVELPTASVPDEIANYVVQHQFRKAENEWPLIQIGPGIITLNDTKSYQWDDFEKRGKNMVDVLFDAYPDKKKFGINRLLLRYIDAIEFDYAREDIYAFLKKHLSTTIDVNDKLFSDKSANKDNPNFDLRFLYPANKPKGVFGLRFSRGMKRNEKGDNVDALIWETRVESDGTIFYKDKKEILNWVATAHELTHNSFFNLMSDELLRRFE